MELLEPGDARAGLVGDEDLETVPVVVGEGQLRARVWSFALADRARPRGPGGEVEICQLGDLGALARLALGGVRCLPGGLR